VPSYATTNPLIADAYARVAVGFVRDALAGRWGAIDAARPFYVVELGAGSGRFAFHFERRLRARLGDAAITARVVHWISDLAPRNVDAWCRNPALQPFLDRGELLAAPLDFESEDAWPAGDGNPVLVVANYLFGSVPADAFVADGGRLRELRLRLSSEDGAPPDEDAASLDGLRFHWRAGAPVEEPYASPIWNRVLRSYAGRAGRSAFTLPVGALRLVDRLRAQSRDRLLVLAADSGALDEDAVMGDGVPAIAQHGAVSMAVNFHALAAYARLAGGELLAPPRRPELLTIVAMLFGAADAACTREAFAGALGGFGPDELLAFMRELDLEGWNAPRLLSLLRNCGHDPLLWLRVAPTLAAAVPTATSDTLRELERAADNVWAAYFHHEGETEDLAFALGVAACELGMVDAAVRCFEASLSAHGPQADTHFNLALCFQELGDRERARAQVAAALASDPGHQAARELSRSL